MDGNMLPAVIGAFIGGVFALLGAFIGVHETFKQEKTKQESFAAAVLYNDLRSIESYLKYERSSVNLRYSEEWQHMVAYCSFLTTYEIEFIYSIYDEVYNYNYHYKLKENDGKVRKEDIVSYKNLRCQMFEPSTGYIDVGKNSKKYQELKMNLKKHIK